jgi:NSS family neurotransmitter:Na+ symporter
MIAGGIAWALGLGTAFSFNIWSDVHIVGGKTFFDVMDYTSNNIMLPLGGMLIAIFTGWILSRTIVRDQMNLSDGSFAIWITLVRFVAPVAVFIVFMMTFV